MASKIKVDNPVVEMDGDEMTRYVQNRLTSTFSDDSFALRPFLLTLSGLRCLVSFGR